MILETAALYLSVIMAVFLFAYAYAEGIKIADSDEEVYGGTFIFSVTAAFIFSALTYVFR
ncbi:hypothetical protein ABE67_02185 [Cytobacillus firmus]|nr:hypothetical protein VL14_22190 [Cytobacillus firmus]OMF51784.1 hypothetical protein BK139_23055 [Paenibacillus sp. FSL R5-0490]PAE22675.1 hypothetical protein CHI10_21945 [Bacillus sp. 7894-2]MBG9446905.1 hypothetical protein [Cytobacillus firmus]MBG9448188.1 hypothetical protein [Cytobacillus firmus]